MWNGACHIFERRQLSLRRHKKGPLMKKNYLRKLGLSLTISAALLGASDLANAQGRHGRGEERSQENQEAREQRQQQRQQERDNRRQADQQQRQAAQQQRQSDQQQRW